MDQLLFKIDRNAKDADKQLIMQMQKFNLEHKASDFKIGALDFIHFKDFGTIYSKHDWNVSNFKVRTTESEYLVYKRYSKIT